MKTLKQLCLIALFSLGSLASAQTILINTTLSNSIGDGRTNIGTVASATGITAPTSSDPTKATFLYVDRELMQVVGVSGTQITSARGVGGTVSTSHASGAVVYVIPGYLGTWFTQTPPAGSCTRGNQIALPVISPSQGVFSDCVGGQWVNSPGYWQTTRALQYRYMQPVVGNVAYTSALGTSTATVAAELYCTEINLPYTKLITGLAAHIGATGGTDKWILALYDSGGNLVANSAVAGTTVSSTAYAWQQQALTAPYLTIGPGQYFGCVQSNGTTATLDLIATGTNANTLTFHQSPAGTFGTLTNFTAPTTFTTLNGPYFYLY